MTTEDKKLFKRELPCKLSNEDAIRYGAQLSAKVRERDLVDETRKSVAAEYGAKIKTITAEISRIAVALDKGEELRPLDVYWQFHAGTMRLVRADTGEVVEVRPATLAERQVSLPGTEGEVPPSDTDFPDLDEGGELELGDDPAETASEVEVEPDDGAADMEADLDDAYEERKQRATENDAAAVDMKRQAKRGPKGPRKPKDATTTDAKPPRGRK